jgi:hypothetical protein
MLLRISLILAILAGLGVIGVSQFMLRPQITEMRDTRDHNKKMWDQTQRTLTKTKKDLKTTQETLTKTETDLEETKGRLVSTTAQLSAEQKRAKGLQENINDLSSRLKTATDNLAAWTNLGLTVDQVQGVIDTNKKLRGDKLALQNENKLFVDNIRKLKAQIIRILGPDEPPPMPPGVRGTVLVVDPKWDFVVLDVGSAHEVVPRGIMFVSRDGDLVAKVRIADVEDERCIANIMPGWKLKEVMEGDIVRPY